LKRAELPNLGGVTFSVQWGHLHARFLQAAESEIEAWLCC